MSRRLDRRNFNRPTLRVARDLLGMFIVRRHRGRLGPAGERRLVAGPGRVTQHLKINKKLDGADATISKEMWLEDRGRGCTIHID